MVSLFVVCKSWSVYQLIKVRRRKMPPLEWSDAWKDDQSNHIAKHRGKGPRISIKRCGRNRTTVTNDTLSKKQVIAQNDKVIWSHWRVEFMCLSASGHYPTPRPSGSKASKKKKIYDDLEHNKSTITRLRFYLFFSHTYYCELPLIISLSRSLQYLTCIIALS